MRTYDVPANWLEDDWQALVSQVVSVSRTVERKCVGGAWERSSETAWWISTCAMSAATYQMATRGHWSVENQNHHVRDIVLREDHSRTRNKPAILARLRSMALNCLRSASEHSITIALLRNALNFSHLRRSACGQLRN